MDLHVICQFLGRIAWAQAGVMGLPLLMALVFAEDSWPAFMGTMAVCALAGWAFLRYGHVRTKKLTMREGIAITGLGWLLATFLGMLPYCLGGYLNYFDGLFESISGFTGTGATVIPDLEVLPQSLLLRAVSAAWASSSSLSPCCRKRASRRSTCTTPNRRDPRGSGSCPGSTT